MGAERARLVVVLQRTLLGAVAEFGEEPGFAPHKERVLATAAALDYVLMLATDSAGTRIPAADAERAIHDGLARGVDSLIAVATSVAKLGTPRASAFAHETAATLGTIVRAEGLADHERTFALIALANA